EGLDLAAEHDPRAGRELPCPPWLVEERDGEESAFSLDGALGHLEGSVRLAVAARDSPGGPVDDLADDGLGLSDGQPRDVRQGTEIVVSERVVRHQVIDRPDAER